MGQAIGNAPTAVGKGAYFPGQLRKPGVKLLAPLLGRLSGLDSVLVVDAATGPDQPGGLEGVT